MPRLSARMLPNRVRIRRKITARIGGDVVDQLGTVAEAASCRLGAASLGPARIVDGKLVAEPGRAVWFGPEEDVQAGDVLERGGVQLFVRSAETQADGVYRKVWASEEQPASWQTA